MYLFSEEKRLQHPLARLIPADIWGRVFHSNLSELEIKLMEERPSELTRITENLHELVEMDQLRALLCILISHPEISDMLIHLPQESLIKSKMILEVAILARRDDVIEKIVAQYPEIETTLFRDNSDDHNLDPFLFACETGNQTVIEWFFSFLSENEIKNLINYDNDFYKYRPFSAAAENGHLHVMQLLVNKWPEKKQEMIKGNDGFFSFKQAASHGHLHVMEWLMSESSRNVSKMITGRNGYTAFLGAATNGHLHVMERLLELNPEIAKNEDNLNRSFLGATIKGYLHVMQRLGTLSPNLQKMIESNNYEAFSLAAIDGRIDVMRWIAFNSRENIPTMIRADNYRAFREAAGNGHLDIITFIISQSSPEDVQKMIEADEYSAFAAAAHGGHRMVMEYLMTLAPEHIQAMIKAKNYAAFLFASAECHREIMEWIITLSPEHAPEMVRGDGNYEAFTNAATKNNIDIMNWLIELSPTSTQAMIRAGNCAAFKNAALNGSAAALERIIELSPLELPTMLQQNDFYAFREVYKHVRLGPNRTHNLKLIKRFLAFDTIFAYAESHWYEYQKYTRPIIEEKLQLLRERKNDIETENTNAVFDIEANEACLCFYILRNLIRQNSPALQDDIRFLLGIPAVRALAHTAVTPNESNELIRLALTTNNQEAAAILLSLPAVRELAEHNNFYQDEAQGRFNLRAIAQDRESSMRALSTGEQNRLAEALKRYQPMMQVGVDPIFKSLKAELIARYKTNPVRIQVKSRLGFMRTIDLPVTYEEFNALKLPPDKHAQALIAYYQNKNHTALRYLSKPNHWIASNASYVETDPQNHSFRYSTFEEYKPLICMLWLAAKDTGIPPTDGFTLETRVDHFIDELALLGRSHNWDETRIVMDSENNPVLDEDGKLVTEEFDDLQGDKPSCYSGVKRRLFQSVLGHPLLKILTLDDIKQELRGFVREYFIQHITDANRDKLRAAWENICGTATFDPCLSELNISVDAQYGFIDYLATKYPAQFNDEPSFQDYVKNSFTLSSIIPAHVMRFGGITGLDGLLQPPVLDGSIIDSTQGLTIINHKALMLCNIKFAANNFLRWMESEGVGIKVIDGVAQSRIRYNHFFHGSYDYNRVKKLLDTIKSEEVSYEDKISETIKVSDASENRRHSFSRFLYNALIQDTNRSIHELPDSQFKTIRVNLSDKLNNEIRPRDQLSA